MDTLLPVILVLIGALCMLAAIVTSVRTAPDVPAVHQGQWRVLIWLMGFFLFGYLAFILVEILDIPQPIQLITGGVFFGGACFVLLIIRLSKSIISSLRERERLLEEARDQLEERVNERTRDLEQTLIELGKETTEHKRLLVSYQGLNSELLQILNNSADGIRIIDQNFIVTRVNNTYLRMIGPKNEQQVGFKCFDKVHGFDCHTPNCPHTIIFNGTPHVEREATLTGEGGKELTCLVTAAPYHDGNGNLIGIIEGIRDISERKAMEERLREMSTTDEMTGLLNRRGFMEVAARQLEMAQRLETTIFVLYADIDDFKQINDTLGHSMGDEAIKETADILRSTFRQADVLGIGRLGGDEFSVLLFSTADTSCDHPVITRLEENLRQRNQATNRPYQLSISTGLVKYDRDNPQSIDELLSASDKTMYACKQKRKAMAEPS